MSYAEAYLAGVFDGEGCIAISQRQLHGTYKTRLVVMLDNTAEELVRPFYERWGGEFKQVLSSNARWKHKYRWRLSGRGAAKCLEDLQPFIRSRRTLDRIALGLAFQAQKRIGGGRWAAYTGRQRDYHARMKKLNARGQDAALTLAPCPMALAAKNHKAKSHRKKKQHDDTNTKRPRRRRTLR